MKRILYTLIIIINLILFIKIIDISIINHQYYLNKYNESVNKIIYGNSAPRGRILDSKGNILVDNIGIKVLTYTKGEYSNPTYEIELSKQLANILDIKESPTNKELLNYYYQIHKTEIDNKVSTNIKDKYNKSIITIKEYNDYKLSLITVKELSTISEKEAKVYSYLNNGYYSEPHVIKSDLSHLETTLITEMNNSSLDIKTTWKRIYLYDTCLNEIFGTIGSIPKEDIEYYQKNNYQNNDIVGLTFLEKYYENYLKGTKAKYTLKNNKLELISPEIKGNDLILNIDIHLQLQIEEIVKKEITNSLKYLNSKYYNGSYIVVSNPKTGNIVSLVSFDRNLKSNLINLLNSSFTVGSVVKGASSSVGYINNVIDKKNKILDSCIKLKSQNQKCSWKSLGYLSDIDALANSSNYFQFLNAIKIAGYKYTPNMSFNPTIDDFNKYRNIFKEYGLGIKTNIDLNEETTGITGSKISGDLLLNLSIGQYDTYTPLELSQYINTIATGYRSSLNLLNKVIDINGNTIYERNNTLLNKLTISNEDLLRIQEGFKTVTTSGTGAGYVNNSLKPSGKTGTSETYYNNESTTTKTFIVYAPYDNPEYSIIIVSPNIAYENCPNSYKYPINSRITRQISNILFEK